MDTVDYLSPHEENDYCSMNIIKDIADKTWDSRFIKTNGDIRIIITEIVSIYYK